MAGRQKLKNMNFKKEIFYLILIASAFILFFPKLSLAADFDLYPVSGSCLRSQPQATLTWQTATGTPYQVWRSVDGGPYSQVYSTVGLSYVDTSIFSDKRYDYQIKTSGIPQCRIGVPQCSSDIERLNPLYCPPYLNEPMSICEVIGPKINLTWDSISGDLDYYRVFRDKDGGGFQLLYETDNTFYNDGPDLYANSQYSYYIEARWTDGGMASSSIWTKTAQACPPILNYATTCLRSVEPGGPRVNLSWNGLLGVQEYDVYQIPPGTTFATRIATTTATTYSDNLVQSLPNQYYNNGTVSYYVQAVWSGVSRDSLTKQVSIFPCPPFLKVDDICQGTYGKYMHLYWTGTLNANPYHIYRGDGAGEPNDYRGQVLASAPRIFDDSVDDPGSYTYKVVAVGTPNLTSNLFFQDIDCTTPNPPLPPPSFYNPVARCQACGVYPSKSVVINSWSSSNNVLYYRLLRSGFGGIYDGATTSFTDCGGEKNYTYDYSVVAFGQNATSGSATSATVTFVDCEQPSTPDPVTFNTGCGPLGSYVSLSWNLTTNTYGYEVWRKEGAGEFSLKSTLASNIHTWTDVPVTTSTLYYYKVIAKGPPGALPKESSVLTVTSNSCIPTLPVLTFIRDCSVVTPLIVLNWTTNGVNTDHFDIYREDYSTTIPIANPGGSIRTWTNSVGGNTAYRYKIVAVGYLGQKTSTSYQGVTSWYCAPPGPFTLNPPTISCPSGSYSYPQSDLSWGNSLEAIQYRLNRYLFSGNSVSETTTVVATITSPYKDRGYGNALSFSGDDYIGFSNSPSLNNLTALTIELWAKPNNTTSFMGVLGTGDQWNSSGTSFYFRGVDPSPYRFRFTVTSGAQYQSISWGEYEKGQYQYGRWYHIVGTYDGAIARLYVDGVFKSSVSQIGIVINDAALQIGKVGGVGGNLRGEIDNVRILGVNKEVNRTIMRGIKYLHPIESLQEFLMGKRQPRPKIGS